MVNQKKWTKPSQLSTAHDIWVKCMLLAVRTNRDWKYEYDDIKIHDVIV